MEVRLAMCDGLLCDGCGCHGNVMEVGGWVPVCWDRDLFPDPVQWYCSADGPEIPRAQARWQSPLSCHYISIPNVVSWLLYCIGGAESSRLH